MSGPELDIARNVKALEGLKTGLVNSLAGLFTSLCKGSADGIGDNLALLIINSFLLARRLGLSFGQLEQRVYEQTAALMKEGHHLEDWYGDLSSLKGYLDMKR